MPGRFSTITVCFQRSVSLSATERARMSVMLPAEKGTTRVTLRLGKAAASDGACAQAPVTMPAAAATAATHLKRVLRSIDILPFSSLWGCRRGQRHGEQDARRAVAAVRHGARLTRGDAARIPGTERHLVGAVRDRHLAVENDVELLDGRRVQRRAAARQDVRQAEPEHV